MGSKAGEMVPALQPGVCHESLPTTGTQGRSGDGEDVWVEQVITVLPRRAGMDESGLTREGG